MRNLWIFISRYNAFFFFVIFFVSGIILTLKNNSYQRSVTLNSTNTLVGNTYQRLNVAKRYLNLGQVNDSMAMENTKLKAALIALTNTDSNQNIIIKDTINKQQYTLLPARVIKNSITLTNNVITINKGSNEGIVKDMAVISPQKGVVGFIKDVSPHFATIRSLLNKQTLISVVVKKNNAFGSLVWGESNYNYRKAYVKEVPNHLKISVRDTIVTSGAGGFPRGIEVGRVTKTQVATGDSFMNLEIGLFNDFSSLQYVYVIKDRLAKELKTLEEPLKNEQ